MRRDERGYFDQWSEKDIAIDGRRRNDVHFCGLVIQKRHVGFSFMPVYAGDDLAEAATLDGGTLHGEPWSQTMTPPVAGGRSWRGA